VARVWKAYASAFQHEREAAAGYMALADTLEQLQVPAQHYRRLTDDRDEPFSFSAPWIARTYGCDELTIRNGKRWLDQQGWLVRAGTAPSVHSRPTQLWQIDA
jgi:hypothetical protein